MIGGRDKSRDQIVYVLINSNVQLIKKKLWEASRALLKRRKKKKSGSSSSSSSSSSSQPALKLKDFLLVIDFDATGPEAMAMGDNNKPLGASLEVMPFAEVVAPSEGERPSGEKEEGALRRLWGWSFYGHDVFENNWRGMTQNLAGTHANLRPG